MKRFFSFPLVLLLSSIFIFTSCGSDDEDPSPFVGKWKLTSASEIVVTTVNGSVVSEEDTLADCVKDDIIELTSDNKVLVDEGSTQCNSTVTQVEGTWSTSSDFSVKISLSAGEANKAIEGSYNLDPINSNTLTTVSARSSTTSNNGQTETETMTKTLVFTKQ